MELVVINLNDAFDLVRFIVILIFLQASQGDKSWLTVGMIKRCEKNLSFRFSFSIICSTYYVGQHAQYQINFSDDIGSSSKSTDR